MIVLMTHDTDISDAWEREARSRNTSTSFSPNGYALGLNVVIYGMTH